MKRAAGVLLRLAACLALAAQLHASALSEGIFRLLDATPTARTAFWGIQIVDLASGQTLFEQNPDRFFVPASNTKLFTTALVLSRLGPDARFQTRVLAETAPDSEGRVHGPLVLAGGGDPNLSGRTLPYRMGAPPGDRLAAIAELADQVAARGIHRVEGGVIGDDTHYVWQPYAEGWAVDDPLYDFGAPVSALSVADNTLAIEVSPGPRAGSPAAVAVDPALEYYSVDNRVRTAPRGAERKVEYARDPGRMEIRLWGSIPLRDRPETLLLGIEDPALYAALAFKRALEERGITVEGEVSARHLYPNEAPDLKSSSAPSRAVGVELARRASAPLLEDLRVTNKTSQNLHAELALRAVGRARRGVGSREAGLEEMQTFLSEAAIDPAAYSLGDGSGLTRLNLVTPAAVVKLLRFMYASPLREAWLSTLPIGAQDGSLASRFVDGPAAGRIYAKTGAMTHVNALSGYARRPDGTWVAFSILVNNSNAPAADVRGIMDRICTLIVE
jgi:serine-type D-Ala-D-Ala carboxypeptidase/endopeptidase (penicillin-binding protein 4)